VNRLNASSAAHRLLTLTAQFNDVCFGGAPHLAEVEKLFSVFPTMDLHFDVRPGAAHLT